MLTEQVRQVYMSHRNIGESVVLTDVGWPARSSSGTGLLEVPTVFQNPAFPPAAPYVDEGPGGGPNLTLRSWASAVPASEPSASNASEPATSFIENLRSRSSTTAAR